MCLAQAVKVSQRTSLHPVVTGLREPHPLRHAISMPGTGRGAEQQQPASPLAGLASLATATSLALGGGHFEHHHPQQQAQHVQQAQQQQPPQHQHSSMSTSRAFAAPLLGSLSSVQQMAILSVPPAAGLQEADITVMCHWMNKVALQLDDVLVDGVHMLAEPVTTAPAGLGAAAGHLQQPFRQAVSHGSPSARFQNLLIYARGRGTVQGYYEAMLTRYELSTFVGCAVAQTCRNAKKLLCLIA